MANESSADEALKARLQRAIVSIQTLRRRVEELERVPHAPIAIIGMGCRFPGHEDGPSGFWRTLHEGVDAVSDFPADRWDFAPFYDPENLKQKEAA